MNYAADESDIDGFTKASPGRRPDFDHGGRYRPRLCGHGDGARRATRRAGEDHRQDPGGRLGTAEDIARGVAFLTADDADFITGSTLSINGGQHMY